MKLLLALAETCGDLRNEASFTHRRSHAAAGSSRAPRERVLMFK
jgi:hypothetical protein